VILAGISHDLRTPLARMQLELEMAKLDEDARNGMQSDLTQMDAIIAQFLEYAKPNERARLEHIDLSALLFECAGEAGRLADVRIHSEIAGGIAIMGNTTDLKRVVGNLIENARRYGKTPFTDRADIDILCRMSGNDAIVEIADHGPGVPDADMERLLRPFTRLDTARGQANGAGLGLAIVERVVKRLHGTLVLSNRDSGGLRIAISIPAADKRG